MVSLWPVRDGVPPWETEGSAYGGGRVAQKVDRSIRKNHQTPNPVPR